ncbi:mitochondrial carrier domain-containing protein [Panaeolus papilionaceus]|nr:mitochondrial carrier domain-containing protein [Panaeolus papilionaceus]
MSSGDEQVALNPTVDFIAGTIAGITGLIVGFPFDTVKVRFQSPEISGRYKSTSHAFTTIVREEKVIGLFKGITSPLATVALMNGLVFASYRFFMKLQLPDANAIPTITQIALAGMGSGIVSSIVTTPTELIKIRQQALLTRTTARQVAFDIFRESGIRGLYRGLTVTAFRDCGYGAYFAAYEATLRSFSAVQGHGPPWYAMLIAGGVAGVAGWGATFPLDVVKTRVQGSAASPRVLSPQGTVQKPSFAFTSVINSAPSSLPIFAESAATPTTPLLSGNHVKMHSTLKPLSNPYHSMTSTIIHSYQNEGVRVFFRGLAPTLIRAVPVNMVTFATFELAVRTLQ